MSFQEILNFRYACKIFDDTKKISNAQFNQILEAGRLSPSSMGMEPWEFWLVQNTEFRAKIQKACWNQAQISTCSHLLIILAKISDLKPQSPYVRARIAQRTDKTQAEQEAYLQRYVNFFNANVTTDEEKIFAWSRAQCYLAAQNMMSMAASLEVDSCPMEGFVIDELEELLGLDRAENRVALVLTFGYRKNPKTAKFRRNLDEILKVFM